MTVATGESMGRVLMMAGGTGGHVFPALAIAQELMNRGYELHWVGGRHGLENRVVPEAGIPLHRLAVRGVRGKGLWQRLRGVATLCVAQVQALVLMLRLRPRCVVGLGGYASAPGGFAAWLLRRPLVIHEQNAVAGTANRLLAPLARRVLCGFEAAFTDGRPVQVIGNPVRETLVQRGAAANYDYLGQRPLRLLVLGGSLGARPLNEVVPAALKLIEQKAGSEALELWHQTGDAHLAATSALFDPAPGPHCRLEAFIEDMAEAYAWADLVLCRAGALTVAELAVMGRPSLLVPLPHAIDDHQTANARALASSGGAIVLPQSRLDAEHLAERIQGFLQQPTQLAAIAAAARHAARPHATRDICDVCEEVVHAA